MEFVEDRPANLRKRDHIFRYVDIPHDGLTRSIVPAKGLRFGKAGVVTRPKTCFVSLLSSRSSGAEWCSVGEHAVQDHREFARQRDLRLVQPISASGSLATFASRTILPLPSTTQTLEHSNDTSIPA
jgi:hypothetical protein